MYEVLYCLGKSNTEQYYIWLIFDLLTMGEVTLERRSH